MIFIILILALGFSYPYIKKLFLEKAVINQEFDKMRKGNLLKFNLKNNTSESLYLDLCHLENCDEYSFKNSGGDYDRLVNYLKIKTLNVYCTIVHYNHSDWQNDVITLHNYSPFKEVKKPILVGIDSFVTNSLSNKIIQSSYQYKFDFLNTLKVKLSPNEEKEISLLTVEEIDNSEYIPIKCALKIKNNSNETQKVKLFDETYYLTNHGIDNIEFYSIFDSITYQEIVRYFDVNPLIIKSIKAHTPDYTYLNYTLNFDEVHIDNQNEASINKEWKSYFNIEMNEVFVSLLEIELKPKQQIYISFK